MRMSKPYAMLRLLQHGPLTVPQAEEITGWMQNETHRAIDKLRQRGDVSATRVLGVRRTVYRLAPGARVLEVA